MSTKNTGGPAFPTKRLLERDVDGMTLRDYFAAKAMQTLLAACTTAEHARTVPGASYEIADAMLVAREAK